MYACELVWEPDTAHRMCAHVERATGEPCPFLQGRRCPFVNVERLTQEEHEPDHPRRLAG